MDPVFLQNKESLKNVIDFKTILQGLTPVKKVDIERSLYFRELSREKDLSTT
jgi:hypothetical protein